MDHLNSSLRERGPVTQRRLVVVGIVRRRRGRTTTLTATPAGAVGRIAPTGGAR
ncbi:hypothetical protein [Streptomyces meridianus]|uniref:Uncharacterized protein n=1 Tax=Streptomyces meridianus TaxID=2938945 RepID=A0ABT0XD80_9ACTN|nr:hypothetical protein [Streptomyces meridianus]MCM2580471.1 hypothetical protein [Streptomyces meridianus]